MVLCCAEVDVVNVWLTELILPVWGPGDDGQF